MDKKTTYVNALKQLPNWDAYLLEKSGLPGPRGNLELAAAVAELGDEARFMHLIGRDLHLGAESANEYLPFCGVAGLGSLLAKKQPHVLPLLRQYANDTRWRLREAAAIALQRWGKADMDALLDEMDTWCRGTLLEQRAAAAALCEPVLLHHPPQVKRVLGLLDIITASLTTVTNRRSDDYRVVRKGLAYCWSVAAAALPEEGKAAMEKWMVNPDGDVRWMMKENLKKNRLVNLDAAWTALWLERLV
jgi:hypothetical protein